MLISLKLFLGRYDMRQMQVSVLPQNLYSSESISKFFSSLHFTHLHVQKGEAHFVAHCNEDDTACCAEGRILNECLCTCQNNQPQTFNCLRSICSKEHSAQNKDSRNTLLHHVPPSPLQRQTSHFNSTNFQAATAAAPPGAGALPPQEGDGFTFEHLANRDSIWLDFVADVGDGGDSTYAVACCMAAPTLLATTPQDLAASTSDGECRVFRRPSKTLWRNHLQHADQVLFMHGSPGRN